MGIIRKLNIRYDRTREPNRFLIFIGTLCFSLIVVPTPINYLIMGALGAFRFWHVCTFK